MFQNSWNEPYEYRYEFLFLVPVILANYIRSPNLRGNKNLILGSIMFISIILFGIGGIFFLSAMKVEILLCFV